MTWPLCSKLTIFGVLPFVTNLEHIRLRGLNTHFFRWANLKYIQTVNTTNEHVFNFIMTKLSQVVSPKKKKSLRHLKTIRISENVCPNTKTLSQVIFKCCLQHFSWSVHHSCDIDEVMRVSNALSTSGSCLSSLQIDNRFWEYEDSVLIMDTISRLPRLSMLHLTGMWANQVGLLSRIFSPNLTSLDFSTSGFTDKHMVTLCAVIPNLQLRSLALENNAFTAETANSLGLALAQTQLKQLNLSYNDLDDFGVGSIVPHLPASITDLNWMHTNIRCASSVCDNCSYCPNLLSLQIDDNRFESGFDSLSRFVAKCPRLRFPFLGDCNLQDKNLLSIIAFAGLFIQNLDIPNNMLSSAGILMLFQVLPQTRLHTLNLDNSYLPLETASLFTPVIVRSLPQTQTLTRLSLRNLGLTVRDVCDVITIIPDTNITHLSFQHFSNFTQRRAKHIACILPSTQLQHLALEDTDVKDKGVIALCSTLPNTNITKLSLDRTLMTRRGLNVIKRMHRNNAHMHVFVRETDLNK